MTSLHGIGVADSVNWDVYVQKCYNTCLPFPGADAAVDCQHTAGSAGQETCKHWWLSYNGSFTDGYSAATLEGLACHEIGHTVGLTHTHDYWCMNRFTSQRVVTDLVGDPVNGSSYVHNRDHINAYL